MKVSKIIAVLCAACFAFFSAADISADDLSAAQQSKTEEEAAAVVEDFDVEIDGLTCDTSETGSWGGFGFITANNSSRLLLDYKQENSDEYWRLLKWLFSADGGVCMSHIKIEMGADINSSSGTEPSTMRSADDEADVTRGAGFQLAADALTINPDITLELLSWGAPGFVKNAQSLDEEYGLRYEWFKKTLDAAYETYGLEFDCISPNYNERTVDADWIIYFSNTLKAETDTPYSYKDIKIVAADEDARYDIAAQMLENEELMEAVDIIGVHYTSTADENLLEIKNKYGKELRYSEGLAPANVSQYAVNADGSGISGVNSLLDVAGRIINMYPNGGFTMYEFQPAVAAYYSGATYYPKQLVTANEPWSGYLDVGCGMYLCEHFGLFAKKGWQFVQSACTGDGTEENHVLYDTTNNVMTLADPETGDYSVILANNTDSDRSYEFHVKNLDKAAQAVQVWETRGPDEGGEYDQNYLKNIMSIEPAEENGEYVYRLTVKANSLVTVSTVEAEPDDYTSDAQYERLSIEYSDDFEYADYDENYLASRGGAPRYTTDQSGAFEVCELSDGNHVLKQMITSETRGVEWSKTSEPVTTLGDDEWANYTVSSKVLLDSNADDFNYAGIGLRYINASALTYSSGYKIVLYQTGKWQLCHMRTPLAEGEIADFDLSVWHTLTITADGDSVSATVDGAQIASVKLEGAVTFSGRVAFYSAYNQNCFDDLVVAPTQMTSSIVRTDNLDSAVSYSGDWVHNTMDSYTCHNRTSSTAETAGDSVSFSFEGDSLALIGSAKADITVEIDGKTVADTEEVSGESKQAFWHRYGLGYSKHDVTVTLNSGRISLDAFEYGSKSVLKDASDKAADIAGENQAVKRKEQVIGAISQHKKAAAGAAVVLAALLFAAVKKRKSKQK